MKRRIQAPLLIAGAILAVVLLHVAGVLQPLENGARMVLLPVAQAFAAVGSAANGGGTSGQTVQGLTKQVQELQSQLSSVSVDYVQLQSLQEENVSLRKVANFLSDTGYDHVGARVIARSTDPQSASVLIDRGSSDGLETGMAVAAEDGVFVGKITSLNERTATVTLVSDGQSRVAASLAGTHQLIGMVQGEGNGVAQLTLVPQSQALKANDIIVTAGTEEKIPDNLAIAMVNDVEGKPTDPFKTATLEPLAQVDQLDLVIVLRPAALRPN
ncbi:MAG: rod shape-determining protein MreC [Patescibacteria group bacterium]